MKSVTLKVVGDINLLTKDGSNPFTHVNQILQCADILFGNLETVLSNEGALAKKAVALSSPPEYVKHLKHANFDVVNLANNHIIDRGVQGVISTIKSLESEGIKHIGVLSPINNQNYIIIQKNEIKIGFLGYTTGRFRNPTQCKINRLKELSIINDIKKIKSKCDIVIISLHWGIENVHYPSPKQIKIAHKIIDEGANVIIGHHPHVLQGIEEYNSGLIVYSLGNFQFDPILSQSTSNDSMIISIKISQYDINYSITPIKINKENRPIISLDDNKRIIREIASFSECIRKNRYSRKWWFEQISKIYLRNNLSSFRIRIQNHDFIAVFEFFVWIVLPFTILCTIFQFSTSSEQLIKQEEQI